MAFFLQEPLVDGKQNFNTRRKTEYDIEDMDTAYMKIICCCSRDANKYKHSKILFNVLLNQM